MIVLCEITYLFVIRLLCRLCAKGGWSGRAERKSQLDKCWNRKIPFTCSLISFWCFEGVVLVGCVLSVCFGCNNNNNPAFSKRTPFCRSLVHICGPDTHSFTCFDTLQNRKLFPIELKCKECPCYSLVPRSSCVRAVCANGRCADDALTTHGHRMGRREEGEVETWIYQMLVKSLFSDNEF